MFDISLVVAGVLFVVTAIVSVEHYRQLRKAQKEYEKARDVVEDIILSFNRQLKSESEKLEFVAYKMESIAAKNDTALAKAGDVEKKLENLEIKSSLDLEAREKLTPLLDEIDKRMQGIVTSQEALTARITVIEDQSKQQLMPSEANIEAVIPIKREKALAPLTETELAVLEMLAAEGPKTAPEIKERVKLSREHTARLMKKLYEGGYLERDTNKIPFKYSVKKEMEKFLKKTESKPA